jgi:carbonic anhydrase
MMLYLLSAVIFAFTGLVAGHSISLSSRGGLSETTYSYMGEQGPINWGHLNKSYSACSMDTHQSPINLDAGTQILTSKAAKPIILFSSVPPMPLVNLGNGLQVNTVNETDMTTVYNRTKYTLLQFHFHTPSEHFIDGEYFPLELHFVHDSQGECSGTFMAYLSSEFLFLFGNRW